MDEKPQNYWRTDETNPQPNTVASTAPHVSQVASDEINSSPDTVSWRASEYIHHDKGFWWYVVLGLITIAGTVLAVFLQQWIFAALILVMGIAIGVYAKRPPREINYSIATDGILINNQHFSYYDFRSFSIVDDGAFFAVQLRPTKRFMPAVTMYFAETDGERIVDALGEHLPMEEMKADLFDKFIQWLRF